MLGVDLSRWAEEAEAAFKVTDAAYQHEVFVFPSRPACPFAGIAEIGGKHVWINGDFSVRVLAHELGHNLGLAHAGGLACTDGGAPAPMGDSCSATASSTSTPSTPWAAATGAQGSPSCVR